MSVGSRIKEAREAKGLTQAELGHAVRTTKQTIFKYENGIVTNIPLDRLEQLANVLSVSAAYLMGWEPKELDAPANIIQVPTMKKIPIVGTIACGTPILAAENIEGSADVPDTIRADFALRCKGDSMINARIYDGDIVYIRQQPTVENGEIAAVLIGDEATLKRFHRYEDRIVLEPANPLFDPLVYRGNEMDQVLILGKAVAFTSLVR